MKFRLVAHWPTDDIFPAVEEFDSAGLAIRRYGQFVRFGMSTVGIFLIESGQRSRISPTKLKKLYLVERHSSPRRSRRMRNTIVSAVLGVIASALPSAFGDFGVVSHLGTLRAARTTRASPRRRGSNAPTDSTTLLYAAASSSILSLSPADTNTHEGCWARSLQGHIDALAQR